MDRRYAPYQRQKNTRKGRAGSHAKQSHRVAWTAEEDEGLRAGVFQFGGKKWKTIAQRLERRSPEDCNERWGELQNLGTVVKRPWTQKEDHEMTRLVALYGPSKWAVIASYLPGRNGKQCRERWHNQLNPAIKKGPWTKEEDEIILDMQMRYGNCWAKITSRLPGRTDNAVKNHWHSSMKVQAKQRDAAAGRAASGSLSSGIKPKTKAKSKRPSGRKRTSRKKASRSSKKRGSGHDGAKRDATVTAATASGIAPRGEVIEATSPASNAIPDPGSLSPDSVSRVAHLGQWTSWNPNVLPYVELVGDILDPLGMGSAGGVPDAQQIDTMMFEQTMAAWYAGEDDYYFPTGAAVDPTSPTQHSSLDPDHLLYDDPMHELCEGVVGSAGLVLSIPMGEVARVYQHAMVTSDWSSSPSTPSVTGCGSGMATLAYVAPELSPIARWEDSSFACKEKTVKNEVLAVGSDATPPMGVTSFLSPQGGLSKLD